MANGFYGPKEVWLAADSGIRLAEPIVREAAERYGAIVTDSSERWLSLEVRRYKSDRRREVLQFRWEGDSPATFRIGVWVEDKLRPEDPLVFNRQIARHLDVDKISTQLGLLIDEGFGCLDSYVS